MNVILKWNNYDKVDI